MVIDSKPNSARHTALLAVIVLLAVWALRPFGVEASNTVQSDFRADQAYVAVFEVADGAGGSEDTLVCNTRLEDYCVTRARPGVVDGRAAIDCALASLLKVEIGDELRLAPLERRTGS